MNAQDKILRSKLIRLAHAQPQFRKQILAVLKDAGCEKLPEGGMRDNCEKKKEEGAKSEDKKASAGKVAIKTDTEDFIQWVFNTQGEKSVAEVAKFVNNVLHVETQPAKEIDPNAVKGPRYQKGDQVEIRADKHTDPATKAVYDQYNGKIGTVTETDGLDALVEFKAGSAPVRFPGALKPRGVGIYAYTPAFVIEGSAMLEMVYLPDPTSKPSKDALAEVEVYVGGGRPNEKRHGRYYTGSCFKAAIGGKGFYFSCFPQQRTRVDPASEANFLPRSFNPHTGKVLYLGLLGKRPPEWKKQLAAIEAKIEGESVGA